MGVRSYMGVPLKDGDGTVIGHLAVLDTRPLPDEPRLITVFELFAERAAAELRRLRAETAVREREEKLARLVDGAMDAIIELDHDAAADPRECRRREGLRAARAPSSWACDFTSLLVAPERERDRSASSASSTRAPTARDTSGSRAASARSPATAPSSPPRRRSRSITAAGRAFHTLILRDVNERIVAEERIRALQDEIRGARGSSTASSARARACGDVLREIDEVAATDASVLDPRRDRHGQGAGRARHPRPQRAPRQAARAPSTAPRSRRTSSRASSSGTRRARSRARPSAATGASSSRTAGRSSSTRSASSRSTCRRSSCACSRRASSSPWARRARARSTCASSRRPTATSRAMIAGRNVPRGPLLPAQRLPDPRPAAARARRRRARPRQHFAAKFARKHGPQARAAVEGVRRASARATTGRATCASSRT